MRFGNFFFRSSPSGSHLPSEILFLAVGTGRCCGVGVLQGEEETVNVDLANLALYTGYVLLR